MALVGMLPKLDDYIFAAKIGSGSYAEVYKAFKKEQPQVPVAIKCVTKSKLSKTGTSNLICEIELLKKLDHKHIVKLRDFAWDDNYIYLIMEYCSGGDLSHFIRKHIRLQESICQRFLQQLAVALKFLRSQNISHFDLKPQNILLSSKNLQILKIADFGLAQSMAESDTNTLIKGSLLYMAPEIIIDKKYTAKADIWSVGVILYECLFGKAPYASSSVDGLLEKIKENKPIKLPYNADVSPDCKDFLHKCLQRDAAKRIDFELFFNHPFVDIRHAPSEHSLNIAEECFAAANQCEDENNYVEAFEFYDDGIKYLAPVMYMEKNSVKRVEIRKKMRDNIRQMETIKRNMNTSKETPKLCNIFSSLNQEVGSQRNLLELIQLAKTTPSMNTAIEIAQTADLYSREKKYPIALEHYQMALGKLLNLVPSEPPGRRKELVLEELKRWMDHAEKIKLCIEGDSDLGASSSVLEIETEKTCMLQ